MERKVKKSISKALFLTSLCELLDNTSFPRLCIVVSHAAQAAEVRKHTANGQRCTNLGWSCIPLAVESYGAWGREAQMCFTLPATRLAVHNSSSKSKMIFELYSRLNLALTRSIARAIITRSFNLVDFVLDISRLLNFIQN